MQPATPRVNLTDAISERSYSSLVRIAFEFGMDYDSLSDVATLSWFIHILKHIKDSDRNFPLGKYATVNALEQLVATSAKQVAHIYYGNV